MDIDLGFSDPQFPGSLAKLQSDQSEPQIHLVDIHTLVTSTDSR